MILDLLRQQEEIASKIEAWKTNELARLVAEGKSTDVIDGVRVKVEAMKTKQSQESALAQAIVDKIHTLENEAIADNQETIRSLQAMYISIGNELVRMQNPKLPELRSKLTKERTKSDTKLRLKIIK
jgi:hypothetical protein